MQVVGGSNEAYLTGANLLDNNTLSTSGNIGMIAAIIIHNGAVYLAGNNDNIVLRHDMSTGIQTRYTGAAGQFSYEISNPYGLAMDAAGSLYIGDNQFCRVARITSAGVGNTYAGQKRTTGCSSPILAGDGGPATSAQLVYPADIALDAGGNLYIGDQGNSAIRKVTSGGTISTIAGKIPAGGGECPDTNELGNDTSATGSCISRPYSLAVHPTTGTPYFGTTSPGNGGKVFKVEGGKFIIAGQVPANSATWGWHNSIQGLAFNSLGDMFFSIPGAVYKLPAGGSLASVVRIAGDPDTGLSYSVDSGAALGVPFSPFRLAVNPSNDFELLVTDGDNGVLWKLWAPA